MDGTGKGGDDFLERSKPCEKKGFIHEINPRYEKAKTQEGKKCVSREGRMRIRYPPIDDRYLSWEAHDSLVPLTIPAHMTPMLWVIPTSTCMPLREPGDLIGSRTELSWRGFSIVTASSDMWPGLIYRCPYAMVEDSDPVEFCSWLMVLCCTLCPRSNQKVSIRLFGFI
jgi:hypothetical protein